MLHILHMYCLNSHVQGLIGSYKKKKTKNQKERGKTKLVEVLITLPLCWHLVEKNVDL